MRFNDIVDSCVAQFRAEIYSRVPYIEGAPGGGKSAAGQEILRQLEIPAEKQVIIHSSLYEPMDVVGLPDLRGDFVRWAPAEMFHRIRKGQGKCGLLLEEVPDALTPMQNALCGVVYDRRAGQLELTDQLAIVCTGNRVKDKSGANRMVSKLANRLSKLDFQENIDDWTQWAIAKGLDPILISFLRFRPELLLDFDPNRFCNPTPRSWERVAQIPATLSQDTYYEHVVGEVSEGPAGEYAGFKRIYLSLPPIDGILKDPEKAMVPTDPATLYALSGALARHVKEATFANMVKYLKRIPPEFSVLTVKDVIATQPKMTQTRAFGEWAMNNKDILI